MNGGSGGLGYTPVQPQRLSATRPAIGVHLLSVLCHLVLARFFAAFRIWQVFRLVPTPAILPMSLSRLTVDIDAVGMLYRTHGNGIARDSHPVPFSTACEAVTKSAAKLYICADTAKGNCGNFSVISMTNEGTGRKRLAPSGNLEVKSMLSMSLDHHLAHGVALALQVDAGCRVDYAHALQVVVYRSVGVSIDAVYASLGVDEGIPFGDGDDLLAIIKYPAVLIVASYEVSSDSVGLAALGSAGGDSRVFSAVEAVLYLQVSGVCCGV